MANVSLQITKDMCAAEFRAFKDCVQTAVRPIALIVDENSQRSDRWSENGSTGTQHNTGG